MDRHLFQKLRTFIINTTFRVDVESDDEYDELIMKWHKLYSAKKEIEESFGDYWLTFTIALCDYNYDLHSFTIEDLKVWKNEEVIDITKFKKQVINLIKRQIEIETII